MLLLFIRPFSSIYPFNERDDVCLNFYYLCPFFFLRKWGGVGNLLGLSRHRCFPPECF